MLTTRRGLQLLTTVILYFLVHLLFITLFRLPLSLFRIFVLILFFLFFFFPSSSSSPSYPSSPSFFSIYFPSPNIFSATPSSHIRPLPPPLHNHHSNSILQAHFLIRLLQHFLPPHSVPSSRNAIPPASYYPAISCLPPLPSSSSSSSSVFK
nr:unnamed protein product [Spirometra erinaceieuropaei]